MTDKKKIPFVLCNYTPVIKYHIVGIGATAPDDCRFFLQEKSCSEFSGIIEASESWVSFYAIVAYIW